MMKKINSIIILLVISLFIITGCEEKNNLENNINIPNQTINSVEEEPASSEEENIDSTVKKHKVCTRKASTGSDSEVELSYDVYYTGEILNLLISKEKIITDNQDTLTEYEDAYKKIASYYEGLEHYDQKVIRTSNSVLNETTINYDEIDIKKLLDIEGEEDNIIEDGKAKVDLYIALLKRFGGTCEDVE